MDFEVHLRGYTGIRITNFQRFVKKSAKIWPFLVDFCLKFWWKIFSNIIIMFTYSLPIMHYSEMSANSFFLSKYGSKLCPQNWKSAKYKLTGNKTRQKGLQNILRSYVEIVLASVYCYCLRAEQSDQGCAITKIWAQYRYQ